MRRSKLNGRLAVLGIEATACVTILDRIIRLPPPVERFSHGAGSAANQAEGQMTNWPAWAAQMITCPLGPRSI